MDRNGYVELENRPEGTFVRIYPAEGTGVEVTLEQLMNYLDKKRVEYANVAQLKKILEQASSGESVCVSPKQTLEFDGWCEYTIHSSGMFAQLTMYPPFKGREDASLDEVLRDIQSNRITYGVNPDLIKAILNSKRYFEPFIFAKGLPARDGYDAVLTYKFNTTIDTTPKLLDNGTVDFHQLDLINRVSEGDVVATIDPEDPGTPGINVLGQEVKPKKVYRQSFKYGHNLKISEDGRELISLVTGMVYLEGDRIFVSTEYDVKADVDNTTGDIEFDGDVHIRGAVRSGFKVNATGTVRVDGVVEAAEITAGKDIILARGISGQTRGHLRCAGNLTTTFIENATVHCEGKIEVDSILHSKVTAIESLEAKGRTGNIIGGVVRAGTTITAKEIGSEMGTNTVIALGTDPELMEKVETLKKQLDKAMVEHDKLQQLVNLLQKKKEVEGRLDADKMTMLQNAMKNIVLMNSAISKDRAMLEAEMSKIHDSSDSRIRISRSIYPGVKLEFGQDSLFIRDRNDHCQYIKRGADIVMTAL